MAHDNIKCYNKRTSYDCTFSVIAFGSRNRWNIFYFIFSVTGPNGSANKIALLPISVGQKMFRCRNILLYSHSLSFYGFIGNAGCIIVHEHFLIFCFPSYFAAVQLPLNKSTCGFILNDNASLTEETMLYFILLFSTQSSNL